MGRFNCSAFSISSCCWRSLGGGGKEEEGRRRSGGGEEEGRRRRRGGGGVGEDIEKGEVEGNVRREHDKNRMYAIISFLYLPPSPLTSSPSLPHVLPFPPHILPFLSSHPSPSPPHILPFPPSHLPLPLLTSLTFCLCQSPAVEGEPATSWSFPALSAGCLPPSAGQHAGDESHAPGERGGRERERGSVK